MDTNYLLKRAQISLTPAQSAASVEARYVHRNLAKAYGLLLAKSVFPHRPFIAAAKVDLPSSEPAVLTMSQRALARWADDGGVEPRRT